MMYITLQTSRKVLSWFRIMPMAFTAFVLIITQSSATHAQWTIPDASQNINNTNTNNVGVGTPTPAYKLEVANSVAKAQIRFGVGTVDSGGFLFSSAASHAAFSAGASWNSGWVARSSSASFFEANAGQLMFYANSALTTGTAFTPTERMRITSTGYVGIGTTSPTNALVIGNDIGVLSNPTSTLVVANNSNNSLITVGQDSLTRLRMKWNYDATTTLAYGVVGTQNINNSLVLQDVGGKVGIGTISPTTTLDVAGQIRSSSGGFKFPDGTVQVTAAGITGVAAGAGLTGGGTSGSVTLTNSDRGSSQSIFKNIANSTGTTQFSGRVKHRCTTFRRNRRDERGVRCGNQENYY